MKCPACGAEGAYVGLSTVECQSRTCRNAVADTPPAASVNDVIVNGGDLRVVGGRVSYEKIVAHIREMLAKVEFPMVSRRPEGPALAAKLPESITFTVPKFRPTYFVLHRSHADRPPTVTTYAVNRAEALRFMPGDEDESSEE